MAAGAGGLFTKCGFYLGSIPCAEATLESVEGLYDRFGCTLEACMYREFCTMLGDDLELWTRSET